MAAATLVAAISVPAAAGTDPPLINYKLYCSGCHLEDGMGSATGRIPPIPGFAGHFLKHEKGRLYLAHVPGVVNSGLPTKQLAPLLNYVLETWSPNELPSKWSPFTGEELDELRKVKIDDISLLRKEIAADLLKQGVDLKY